MAILPVSLHFTCRFDFASFPFDVQVGLALDWMLDVCRTRRMDLNLMEGLSDGGHV